MTYTETDPESWVDPVSHQAIDPRTSLHQSFHAGQHYYFADLTNKQTFDADPQLWVAAPYLSQTPVSLSPA